jgi:hypothetical protein
MMRSQRVLTAVRAGALALVLTLAMVPAHAETAATTAVLQLVPDSAQVAVAIPPLGKTLDRGTALAKKLAPEDVDIDAEVQKVLDDLAKDAGVPDAKTLQDIATARGVDSDAPLAVFFDLSESVVMPEKAAGEDESEDAEEKDAPEPELKEPKWVLVVGVADDEKALASLEELVNEVPELSKEAVKDVAAGDHTIKAYGDMGYLMFDDKVAVGSVDMLKGVAARITDPAEVRYGTEDLPAGSDTEVAALVYGKRLLPILEAAAPALETDDEYGPLLDMQLASLKGMFGADSPDDPMVVTYTLADDRIALESKIDTATHPGVLEYSGEAQPLRLAPMLPEHTLAFITLRFNDETRKQMSETLIPAIASATGGDSKQAMAFVPQILELLGEEVTLGVASEKNDFPALVLMLALKEPESAKGFIKVMAGQYLLPGETHNEVEINSIAAPSPIQFSVAMPDDLIIISNNVDVIKGLIDLNKSGGKTDLFANMDPALPAGTPRYNAVVLNSALLTDVVIPLSALAGGIPDEFAPVAEVISGSVKELRLLNEMDGTWSTTKVHALLK